MIRMAQRIGFILAVRLFGREDVSRPPLASWHQPGVEDELVPVCRVNGHDQLHGLPVASNAGAQFRSVSGRPSRAPPTRSAGVDPLRSAGTRDSPWLSP